MFLSDIDIQKNIESGDILITDFDNSRLQPASYDIRLGNKFLVVDDYKSPVIDPVKKFYQNIAKLNFVMMNFLRCILGQLFLE